MVVTNKIPRPKRKTTSAICSYLCARRLEERNERNEKIQLAINITMAMVVISSAMVTCDTLNTRNVVSKIKQIPNKLEDAVSIC